MLSNDKLGDMVEIVDAKLTILITNVMWLLTDVLIWIGFVMSVAKTIESMLTLAAVFLMLNIVFNFIFLREKWKRAL